MNTTTDRDSTAQRIVSAMFDTNGAARKAVDDLVAAGIARDDITQTDGHTAGEAVTTRAERGEQRGFWDSLKDLFFPEEDRWSYAEGLQRGGTLITVRTDAAHYARALDILDSDGAVDMGERENEWRSAGWTGYAGSLGDVAAGDTSGMPGPRMTPGASVHDDAAARAAALGQAAGPGTAPPRTVDAGQALGLAAQAGFPVPAEQLGLARRDDTHGRSRLRSYVRDQPAGAQAPFAMQADTSRIVEHMEVISSDGQRIGTVDHLDGPDRIKLAKSTSPDGQHHYVPLTWVDHIDQHVHLKRSLADIRASASANR